MSKALEQFKKSYDDFYKYSQELAEGLAKSNLTLLGEMQMKLLTGGEVDFSQSPFNAIDNKTLAELKAMAIYTKISRNLLPKLLPDSVDINLDETNFASFRKKLKPTDLIEALDTIQDIAAKDLDDTILNRTNSEIILNLLKDIANLLISLVSFGTQPNFFKSSTFHITKINDTIEDLNTNFGLLEQDEKIVELEISPSEAKLINKNKQELEKAAAMFDSMGSSGMF